MGEASETFEGEIDPLARHRTVGVEDDEGVVPGGIVGEESFSGGTACAGGELAVNGAGEGKEGRGVDAVGDDRNLGGASEAAD